MERLAERAGEADMEAAARESSTAERAAALQAAVQRLSEQTDSLAEELAAAREQVTSSYARRFTGLRRL